MSGVCVRNICKVAVVLSIGGLFGTNAFAFDPKAAASPDACCDAATMTALRDATRAYYSGDKREALTGLLTAAQSGHPAAQWKLGRMYAKGDGVAEDDMKAFEFFSQLISAHGEDAPTSPDAPFISNAFVELGSYYLTGIANSAVAPNVNRAREIFTYAASYFGDALAQVKLGDMYLDGVGVDQDPRQAARWFLLAARKGQIDAQAKLGEMLVRGDQIEPNPVHGLMWLTIALKRSELTHHEDASIRSAHEEAFSLASEDERRKAIALADQWLMDNDAAFVQANALPERAVEASATR
jgi:TPR repeat protein